MVAPAKSPDLLMDFSRTKGWSIARSARSPIAKGAQLALLLCGLLGIAAALLVLSAIMASFKANASNRNELSGGEVHREAPTGMVWVPEGAFLMGTNDKESFPNERPAHLVQVQGFWMDEHVQCVAMVQRLVSG
jgi:hypothetical protein